jgi:uncharacterized protein (DUF2147 family)
MIDLWRGMLGAAVVLMALVWTGAAQAQSAVGTWRSAQTERGHIEIVIAPCGAALCGTIARAFSPAGQPATKAEFAHLGRKMIWDMMPDGPGQWSGGKIWDPHNDKTYRSKMKISGGALKVSGWVMVICQEQTWRAVK